MSIIDHTVMTEQLARSICNTNQSPLKDFTGGVISDSDENRILNQINSELRNSSWPTTGNVPESVYHNVSRELEVYTPGMNRYAISNVLKSNNLFGNSERIEVDVDSRKYDRYVDEYNKKNDDVEKAYDENRSNNMTTGFTSDAINQLGNQSYIDLQRIMNRVDSTIRIDRKITTAVNSMMSGAESVLFSSFPSRTRTVLADMVRRSRVPTRTSGKTISLGGGGGVILNGGEVNLSTGHFGLSFNEMSTKQRSEVAAESIIAETGADPDAKEAISTELQAAGLGTLSGRIEEQNVVNDDPVELGGTEIKPGKNFISSVEELEYEMGSMTRDITEVIVHWSETYTDANLSAETLEELTGAGKNAYHLIIKRDGSVQRGVPMNSVGDHCDTNNHNSYSIGVCLIGGVNVSSGDNELEQLGANSITRSQFNSLYQIFRTFFNHYPGGQALGHMDIDATQSDPGFDVRDYVYNNFNKTTLYYDPLTQSAISPAEILDAVSRNELRIQKDPDVMDKRF